MTIRWNTKITEDDEADAFRLLSLLMPGAPSLVPGMAMDLEAKDVLRACGLPALARDVAGVKKYLDRIKKGTALAPVIVVRGNYLAGRVPLLVEGYHRTSAAYWIAEDTIVRVHLSTFS